MANSPIHEILNDIRSKYTGLEVSILDIRRIEELFKICSILNTRNGDTAYLRITAYGMRGVAFEDICIDFTKFHFNADDVHCFIFQLSKALYEVAYGVHLIDGSEILVEELKRPNLDFSNLQKELLALQDRCAMLEQQVASLKSGSKQGTIFD